MQKVLLCALGICFIIPSFAQSGGSANGVIRGTVVDDKGAPLKDELVSARPYNPDVVFGMIDFVQTDKSGHFSFDHLPWGKYTICTHENADFPNTCLAGYFYRESPPDVLTLSAQSPTTETVVHLGTRPGVIIGSISDAFTGAPVGHKAANTMFHLWRIKNPKSWANMPAPEQYKILTPAGVEVGIKVQARGYQDWYYPGVSDPAKALSVRLQSGQELKLDIKLHPKTAEQVSHR